MSLGEVGQQAGPHRTYLGDFGYKPLHTPELKSEHMDLVLAVVCHVCALRGLVYTHAVEPPCRRQLRHL